MLTKSPRRSPPEVPVLTKPPDFPLISPGITEQKAFTFLFIFKSKVTSLILFPRNGDEVTPTSVGVNLLI